MPKISDMKFPSFYCECAYRDGFSAQRSGDHSAATAYYRHGEPEPLGTDWYNRGAKAALLGLVEA